MPLLQIGKPTQSSKKTGREKLYISVSSEGFGHSSRALAIAGQFPQSQVLMGSYSYALERLQSFGYMCLPVSQELKFIGSQGSFDVGKTIFHNQARALGFNQIVQEEMDIMKKQDVTLVVADGRMAPVLAAAKLDIPCVVVTNQSAFYPFFEQDSPLVKLFGRSFEWVMKLWLSSAEEIFIPDLPPPHTVCLPNLSDNYQVKKRTRFVGPLVAWRAEDIEPIERPKDKPLIVVSLGGHDYRKPLFDKVLEVAKQNQNIQFELMTTFTATHVPDNVNIHAHVKDAAAYFKASDLVITQGGHSTAMELLTLGRPSIVVPDMKQREQENNAARLVELGVSEKVSYDDLTTNRLMQSISTLLDDPRYANQAAEMAEKAREIDGANNAASILRDYAARLLAY